MTNRGLQFFKNIFSSIYNEKEKKTTKSPSGVSELD